jgi:hypothetical protein
MNAHDLIPADLIPQRLEKFEIDLGAAARLAASVEDESLSSTFMDFQNKTRRRYSLLARGESADFYRGATHGLQLAARTAKLFREKIIVRQHLLFKKLQQGSLLLSGLAAKYWLALDCGQREEGA